MSMISLMDTLMKSYDQDLRLTIYQILAYGSSDGIMECVDNSKTLQDVLINYNYKLYNYFIDLTKKKQVEDPDYKPVFRKDIQFNLKIEKDIQEAICQIDPQIMYNYIESLAGYCCITYLLGLGDRHMENLMLDQEGRIFHIDFGYAMDEDPKWKPTPFKLNAEMIYAMGGRGLRVLPDLRKQVCVLLPVPPKAIEAPPKPDAPHDRLELDYQPEEEHRPRPGSPGEDGPEVQAERDGQERGDVHQEADIRQRGRHDARVPGHGASRLREVQGLIIASMGTAPTGEPKEGAALLRDFDLVSIVRESILGEVSVYKHKQSQEVVYVKETMSEMIPGWSGLKQFVLEGKYRSPCFVTEAAFVSSNTEGTNLEKGLCSGCHGREKLTVVMKDVTRDLEKEIQCRASSRVRPADHFKESEVWYILQAVIDMESLMNQSSGFHGDVRSTTTFISENGKFKFADTRLVDPHMSSLWKTAFNVCKCPLPPEQLTAIVNRSYKRTDMKEPQQQSEV